MIVLNVPLGKTSYYAIRVEFQARGIPHIHSFVRIINAPKLTKESKQEYIQWVDSIIRTDMPDPASEAELFELVRTFQVHRHSKTCRNIGLINAGFILENSFHHQQFLQNLFPMICQRKLRFRY